MDQLDSVGRERRDRKSISDIMDAPRQMSPLKLNLIPENPFGGVLYGHTRQNKRSIIKINKSRLPVDFFSNELPESIARRNIDRKAFLTRQYRADLPTTQRRLCERIDGRLDNYDSKDAVHSEMAENKFKMTSSFGSNHITKSNFRRDNIHINEQQTPMRFQYRVNETRSQQKREKPVLEKRKFTAAAGSNKPDAIDLFSRERLEGEYNDAVVFTGGGVPKQFQERDLPSRSMAVRDATKNKEKRIDRRIDFQNMKFDVTNLRIGDRKAPQDINSPLRRQPGEQTNKQASSPTRRQISPSKKQMITPVKIIVTNTDPRKIQSTPMSQSANNPSNQFFDVTFYNTKSSVLPPITK